MVNALVSSKVDGTKQFKQVNGNVFGWKAITDLYKHELVRVSNNQARMVPRLREANCLRDSWTKLNVLPAKIMQVLKLTSSKQLYTAYMYEKTKTPRLSI